MAKQGTFILQCNCNHEFQDAIYGKGNRIHNVTEEGKAYCTVCAPNYSRNKTATAISANPMLGMHYGIPARGNRVAKSV